MDQDDSAAPFSGEKKKSGRVANKSVHHMSPLGVENGGLVEDNESTWGTNREKPPVVVVVGRRPGRGGRKAWEGGRGSEEARGVGEIGRGSEKG